MANKNSAKKNISDSKFFIGVLLFLIFALASFLRFYHLDRAPSGVLVDEANFGYIAYSLLQTGADEHGHSWPLIFQGFGDQKLPGYAYLLLPFIYILDLSVASTRAPSALVGSLSVFLMFFLLKKLFVSDKLALTGAFLMALSPFPFFMSRFAFESNLGLFFFLIALNGVVRISDSKRPLWWALVAGLFSGLTWYSYIAYRPITFALLMIFAFVSWRTLRESKKLMLVMMASFMLVVTPFLISGFGGSNSSRLKQIGIFYDQSIPVTVIEQRTFCSNSAPNLWCYALFNKPAIIVPAILGRFFSTFSPSYLAFSGDSDGFLTVKNYGQFALFLYPFFILGLMILSLDRKKLFRSKQSNIFWVLVISGLLITPLPAIISGEPQKIRLSPLLPFLIIVYVIGIRYAWRAIINWYKKSKYNFIPNKTFKRILLTLALLLFLIESSRFFTNYFTVHASKNDYMYQSEMRGAMELADTLIKKGNKVVVSSSLSEPAIFYAFYSKMDPRLYQQELVLNPKDDLGFQHMQGVKNLYASHRTWQSIACQSLRDNQPTFYVTNEQLVRIEPAFTVYSDNGVMKYLFIYDVFDYATKNKAICASEVLTES